MTEAPATDAECTGACLPTGGAVPSSSGCDVKGNVEAAASAFRRSDRSSIPGSPLAHAALGEAYWRQYAETREAGWMEKAVDASTTALRFDPERPEVRYTAWRHRWLAQGKLDEQRMNCREHWSFARRSMRLIVSLGRCWRNRGTSKRPRWRFRKQLLSGQPTGGTTGARTCDVQRGRSIEKRRPPSSRSHGCSPTTTWVISNSAPCTS